MGSVRVFDNSAQNIYQSAIDKIIKNKGQLKGLEITIDSEVIKFGRPIAQGHSKTIFDIGNGKVIAVASTTDSFIIKNYITTEVELAKKLNSVGLKTPDYTQKLIYIQGQPLLVIQMSNFSSMTAQGQQVRDRKDNKTKLGNSFLFGKRENLTSEDHWENLLKHIFQEIVLYLSNGYYFSSEAFNLIITDTEKSPSFLEQNSFDLFSNRAQEVHLYFFDMSDIERIYQDTKINYHFTDKDGNILKDEVRDALNRQLISITTTIMSSVTSEEYDFLGVDKESIMRKCDLDAIAKEAYTKVWNTHLPEMIAAIKSTIEKLPKDDRVKKFCPIEHSTEKARYNIVRN